MRTARVTPEGEVHHVISRFVEKRLWVTTDGEREHYLRLLGKALQETDWTCLAYAVMSSHVHLAMIAGHHPSESWSRRVNGPFARWFNERHERFGALFAGRASMWVERTANVGRLLAYIHNNPVRAGVVRHPAATTWTSHRAYIGETEAPAWLAVDRGLDLTGLPRDEFASWVREDRSPRRTEESLAAMDREARRLGAIVLGTPRREPLEAPLVARPFAHVRPNPGRVIEVVCEVFGLSAEGIFERGRGQAAVARAVAIQAATAFGVTRTAVGDALGISPQAASKLAMRELDDDTTAALRVVCRRVNAELDLGLRKYRASPPKLVKMLESDG
jgi:REP element-mobilizing transposase RayT